MGRGGDGAGNTLREYITLGGATVAIVDAGGTVFVHSDHLGAPQVMTDGSAAVVWDASYRPFGEATITGFAANDQRFPGQYADAETGYYDNWYRTYDPTLGRYLQSDPIGLAAGFNTYAYANSNPVMYIDPDGLDTAVIVGAPTPQNPFGHVGIATMGKGVTTFGTGTPRNSSLKDYLHAQSTYRSQKVYIIPTTTDEEDAIQDYLNQFPDALPPVPSLDSDDTCATRTSGALSAAGYYDLSTPYSAILSMFGVNSPLPEGTEAIAILNSNEVIEISHAPTRIPLDLYRFNPP